jgi:hypothetical protein
LERGELPRRTTISYPPPPTCPQNVTGIDEFSGSCPRTIPSPLTTSVSPLGRPLDSPLPNGTASSVDIQSTSTSSSQLFTTSTLLRRMSHVWETTISPSLTSNPPNVSRLPPIGPPPGTLPRGPILSMEGARDSAIWRLHRADVLLTGRNRFPKNHSPRQSHPELRRWWLNRPPQQLRPILPHQRCDTLTRRSREQRK